MFEAFWEMIHEIGQELGYDVWLDWYLDGVTKEEYFAAIERRGGIGGDLDRYVG